MNGPTYDDRSPPPIMAAAEQLVRLAHLGEVDTWFVLARLQLSLDLMRELLAKAAERSWQ